MKTQDPLPIPEHAKNMTMRDYYAGQALAGAAEAAMRRGLSILHTNASRLAEISWLLADEMIRQRAKETNE